MYSGGRQFNALLLLDRMDNIKHHDKTYVHESVPSLPPIITNDVYLYCGVYGTALALGAKCG